MDYVRDKIEEKNLRNVCFQQMEKEYLNSYLNSETHTLFSVLVDIISQLPVRNVLSQ